MQRSTQRGAAVLFSLGVVVLLSALGSTVLLRSLNETQLGRRSAARQSAFFLAEAGLDQALLNLRTPDDASDDVTANTLLTGTFQVDSPTSLGNNRWQVTAHGTAQQEQRTMQAIIQLAPQSVFQFALFGNQAINVSGNATTDSYDSSTGPYDDDTAGHNGDMGTNAVVAGGVNVSGSIFVDGQVAVGPNVSNPASVVTGYNPAFITGGTSPPTDTQDVVSQGTVFPMPAVTVPAGLTCSDKTITGNTTVTLTPGTYCYHDLTIQGNADLVASGDVTIYITGEMTAQGNSVVGVASDPGRMLFLMSSSAGATLEQTITGSNIFYGAIYGPQATITITGNADVYGSIIAKQVNLTGSAEIHYDEALANETQISNVYQTSLTSWREL